MTGQPRERARQRCRRRSILVESLVACLVTAEAGFLAGLGASLLAPDGAACRALLGLIWLLAGGLYAANLALVRTGPQAERISHAPMLVNRPGFVVRLGFHLVINWSAVAVTLIWAAALDDPRSGARVAGPAIAVIVLLWISFNVMHRRFNRARNLLLSTVPAAALLLAAVMMLRLAGAELP